MRIIGIDPSLVNTGLISLEGTPGSWVLSKLYLHTTESAKSTTEKIRKNYDDLDRARDLRNAILYFVEDSDFICVEIPQIGGADMQARSMWMSGIVLGIVASLPPEKLVYLTPAEVKKVTGNKTASKEDMCTWAYSLYPDAAWPSRKCKGAIEKLKKNHHLADALACTVAGLAKKEMWLKALPS